MNDNSAHTVTNMSEDGMEVDDLARAIRGLSGFKGHFTREVNNIIRLVPLAQACPTRALCEKLSEDLGRLETAYNRLAEHCTMLAQHDDDADRRRGYEATINQAEQNFGKWQTTALSLVSQFEANTQANNAVQQAAADAPAGAGRPRAIEALRPEKLTRNHTLAELRSWEIKFRDFFETSFLGNIRPLALKVPIFIILVITYTYTLSITIAASCTPFVPQPLHLFSRSS